MGDFVLSESPRDRIAFLIGGIGITPVIPMLRELQEKDHKGKVHLFYSNKEQSTAAYLNEIEANRPDNFTLVNVHTRTDKRINEILLKEHLGALDEYNYYLVGASSFIKGMKELLLQNGIKTSQIKEDDYG